MRASYNSMKIGGHSKRQLIDQFQHRGGVISPEALVLMDDPAFATFKSRTHMTLISWNLGAMVGGPGTPASWSEMMGRVTMSGIYRLPAEAAINYLIQASEADLLPGDYYVAAMHPIQGQVFVIERQLDGTFHLGALPVTDIRVINSNTWAVGDACEMLRGRTDVDVKPLGSPPHIPSQALLAVLLVADSAVDARLLEGNDECDRLLQEGLECGYIRETAKDHKDMGPVDCGKANYDLTPLGKQVVIQAKRTLVDKSLISRV